MCSRILGPAMKPSLVIWPISMTGTPVSLAKRSSCAATSLICDTDPGAESSASVNIVCTESTIISCGIIVRASSRMFSISVSLKM